MRNKRHRQPLEILSNLNVTNLLDTAFILLITFMLVAPQLTHGIKLDPPEVRDAPTFTQDVEHTVQVIIGEKEEGEDAPRLYYKGLTARENRVTLGEIAPTLTDALDADPELAVVIQCDKDTNAELLLQVIREVQRAGVTRMGVRTDMMREEGE